MSRIREHVWVLDRCIMCGAVSWRALRSAAFSAGKGDAGTVDERQCIEREDYHGKLCPEPARRPIACEAFDAIRKRVDELRAEQEAIYNSATN